MEAIATGKGVLVQVRKGLYPPVQIPKPGYVVPGVLVQGSSPLLPVCMPSGWVPRAVMVFPSSANPGSPRFEALAKLGRISPQLWHSVNILSILFHEKTLYVGHNYSQRQAVQFAFASLAHHEVPTRQTVNAIMRVEGQR